MDLLIARMQAVSIQRPREAKTGSINLDGLRQRVSIHSADYGMASFQPSNCCLTSDGSG